MKVIKSALFIMVMIISFIIAVISAVVLFELLSYGMHYIGIPVNANMYVIRWLLNLFEEVFI
jgi:hypothetical protein